MAYQLQVTVVDLAAALLSCPRKSHKWIDEVYILRRAPRQNDENATCNKVFGAE
jgi:hypothetical protein